MKNEEDSRGHLGMGACFHGNFFYIPDGLVIHASNS